MITVHIPSVLSRLADGQRTIAASGATLGEAIDDVVGRHPQLAPRLRDADGQPYSFVTFYLNDEDIRFTGGFAAAVADGDEVVIVPAIAGG
jgi:molybdopterin converting factor small subunit